MPSKKLDKCGLPGKNPRCPEQNSPAGILSPAAMPMLPGLVIASRQRGVPCELERISAIVRTALPDCLAASKILGGPLAGLRTVEFSIVGSRTMARVHREFLNIRGATDVITFPYGEIIVCATVAASRAPEFGHTISDELALYCIHGLLHLAGHDDIAPSDAARMHRAQERILRSAMGKLFRRCATQDAVPGASSREAGGSRDAKA